MVPRPPGSGRRRSRGCATTPTRSRRAGRRRAYLAAHGVLHQLRAVCDTIGRHRTKRQPGSRLRDAAARPAAGRARSHTSGPMDEQSADRPSRQRLVVGIRFKPGGLTYDFDPGRHAAPSRRSRRWSRPSAAARWAPWPCRPTRATGRRPLDRVVKKADARDLVARMTATCSASASCTRAVLAVLGAPHGECKLVKVESAARRQQGDRLPRRRGTPRAARPGRATLAQALRTHASRSSRSARATTPRWPAGSGVCGRELCCSSWLTRVPARLGEDGEGAGAGAQPVQARGPVRPAQVLHALRVPDLPRAASATCRTSARRWRA